MLARQAADIWGARASSYGKSASRPFRTVDLAQVAKAKLTDLGLYSITFVNDVEADLRSLEAFKAFRADAAANGIKYFLEVFNPNVEQCISAEDMPFYVNDCIIRSLAAVPQSARTRFLKVVYNGPRAMEELAGYDPNVIVGVLGGGSGTTFDCLKLLHDSKKYGARIALFGRKINLAEDPLGMIAQMRHVADGDASPAEAVKA